MAQFEGQSLHVVRLQAIVVIDDVIVSGVNSPPVSSLADQVEVIPAEKRGGSGEKGSQSRVKLKQSTMCACERSVWGLGGSLESQALAVCASLKPGVGACSMQVYTSKLRRGCMPVVSLSTGEAGTAQPIPHLQMQ